MAIVNTLTRLLYRFPNPILTGTLQHRIKATVNLRPEDTDMLEELILCKIYIFPPNQEPRKSDNNRI
jgi:hypothetical protein